MLHDVSIPYPGLSGCPDYETLDTRTLLARALADPALGRCALVSSFGAESVVLLHLISRIKPDLPILFIDTELLFAETLRYQKSLARLLGLSNVQIIRAHPRDLSQTDPHNRLHISDPDSCCNLRKVQPLQRALQSFDTWISGRKRYQGGLRASLPLFEKDGEKHLKINPLANWSAQDIHDYIEQNNLPRHPLLEKGYHSIGCKPCTRPASGRTGRWSGQNKTECGIHLRNGRVVSRPAAAVLVRDGGFVVKDQQSETAALDLPGDTALQDLPADLHNHSMIRITFSNFADGRGFTLARDLRRRGYRGCLRACGPLLADQYSMIRRVGFDEVEIPAEHARRQPERLWQARANWQAYDYQSRLQGWTRGRQHHI